MISKPHLRLAAPIALACGLLLGAERPSPLNAPASTAAAARALRLELRTRVDGYAAEFGEIGAVVADDDGRIYVADVQAQQIVILDATGQKVGVMGGRGSGPGEFTGLRPALAWVDDYLLAADWRQSRLTAFDASGRVRMTAAWPTDLGLQVPERLFVGGGNIYGLSRKRVVISMQPGAQYTALPPPVIQYVRIALDGRPTELTFQGMGTSVPWPTGADCPNADRSVIHLLEHPFMSGGPAVAFLPADEVGLADRDAWQIDIMPLGTGDGGRRHRRDIAPLRLTDALWEAQPEIRYAREVERSSGRLQSMDGGPCPILENRPEYLPVLRTLISDEAGRLWVEATSSGGFSVALLSASGQLLGETTMPARDRRVAPYARANLLYLVTRDEHDVQSIEVYEALVTP